VGSLAEVTLVASATAEVDLAKLLEATDIPVADRSSAADITADDAPGIVVMLCDTQDGDATIRHVVGQRPAALVVVVGEEATPAAIRRSVNSGAAGYVRLEEAEAVLAPTIRAVAAGQLVIPFGRRKDSIPETLTTREKQILSLVVMGLRNREIARKLYVAESTVKSHLSSAFSKLGVGSRNEATALILDPRAGVGMGILTIPSQAVGGRR